MKDVLTALREMGRTLPYFGKQALQLFLAISLGVGIMAVLLYAIVHYFWGVLGAVLFMALVGWFYVEYTTAKTIREYEEMINERL